MQHLSVIQSALRCSVVKKLFIASLLLLIGIVSFGSEQATRIAQAAPNVRVEVIIERVREIDVGEGVCAGDSCKPDFYGIVKIDGVELPPTQVIPDKSDISPNWGFSRQVDLAKGNIPIQIDIYDEDGPDNDDHVDLDPGGDKSLGLVLDLTDCLLENLDDTDSGNGECDTQITSSGDNGDRAQIWFRVRVSGQLNPPTGVSASDGTYANRVRVAWNKANGAKFYEVWRHTANNPNAATRIASSVSSTVYNDTTATPGQTYYYWVKAKSQWYATSPFSSDDSGYRPQPRTDGKNVQVTIERVKALDCVDEFFICSEADFYAIATIDGVELPATAPIYDKDDIFPNWHFAWRVDPAKKNIPVQIQIYDDDSGSSDDLIDLDANSGRSLDLTFDLAACTVSGDISGDCDSTLTSSGTSNDKAQIWLRLGLEQQSVFLPVIRK